jgi:hypothetical protein
LIGGLSPSGTSYAELAARVESEARIRLGAEVRTGGHDTT